MLGKALPHTNKQFEKNLGGAWGGTLVRSIWALPGCILKMSLKKCCQLTSSGINSVIANSESGIRFFYDHFRS